MPKINLINERRTKEKRETAIARVMLYGIYLLVAAILFVYVVTAGQQLKIGAAIENTKAEKARLQDKIAQVKALQTESEKLAPRVDLLKTARESTIHWYMIYQLVGQRLPATSWLENLGVVHTKDVDHLNLTGKSLSEYTVADTILKLQAEPYFSNVELHSVSASADKTEPVHFEIAMDFKKPDNRKPDQTKPDEKK